MRLFVLPTFVIWIKSSDPMGPEPPARPHVNAGRGRSSSGAHLATRDLPGALPVRIGKQLCSIFGGVTVEDAVVEAVLESLSPVRMEVLVHARERLTSARTEKRQQLELELERARYEADRCRRQYDAVEPENRLVARSLERRWDEVLERVNDLNEKLSQFDTAVPPLTVKEEDALRHLADDLPQLWHPDAAPFDLKKRIVRTVIKEIIVFVDKKTLRVLIHRHGGEHSEFTVRKRNNGEHRWKTTESTLSLIEQLARVMSDKQIAAQLNRMGIKSAKGYTWTRVRVGNFRKSNNILNYTPGERQARGELTRDISRWPERRMAEASSTPDSVVQPVDSRLRGNDGFGIRGDDHLGAITSFPRKRESTNMGAGTSMSVLRRSVKCPWELTVEEAAEKLGVSYSTVQRMIQRKQLPGVQICPGAPWIIGSDDLDALRTEGHTNEERDVAPSSGFPGQQTLAFSWRI